MEFSFKNPLREAQVKSSNDEYTRRPQGQCSYYKRHEKGKANRGKLKFSFDEKLTIHQLKKKNSYEKFKNDQKLINQSIQNNS